MDTRKEFINMRRETRRALIGSGRPINEGLRAKYDDGAYVFHKQRCQKKLKLTRARKMRKWFYIPIAQNDWNIKKVKNRCKRLKNWIEPINDDRPTITTTGFTRYSPRFETNTYYRGGWNHNEYRPVIRASALITATGRYLYFVHCDEKTILKAPRGWKWKVDKHGVCICRKSNNDINFHPNSTEIYDVAFCVNAAKENHEKQRQLKQKTKIQTKLQLLQQKLKDNEVYVTLLDAIDAGNCVVGIQRFLAAHKRLQGAFCIRADMLKLIESTDTYRVSSTIQKARQRVANEMLSGFADYPYQRIKQLRDIGLLLK